MNNLELATHATNDNQPQQEEQNTQKKIQTKKLTVTKKNAGQGLRESRAHVQDKHTYSTGRARLGDASVLTRGQRASSPAKALSRVHTHAHTRPHARKPKERKKSTQTHDAGIGKKSLNSANTITPRTEWRASTVDRRPPP